MAHTGTDTHRELVKFMQKKINTAYQSSWTAYAAWHCCVKRSVEASSRESFDLRKLSGVITQKNGAVRKGMLGRVTLSNLNSKRETAQ